jgi:hypothetical protein
VTIRVTDVHLANLPRHFGRWESNIQCGGHALSVDFVDVVHPNRHPHAVIGCFVSVIPKRGGIWSLAAPSLGPWQRKISDSSAATAPKIGGVPQSQHFFQPHFLNQAKLAAMSDTFKIGVMHLTSMGQRITKGPIGNEIFLMNEEAEGGKALTIPV